MLSFELLQKRLTRQTRLISCYLVNQLTIINISLVRHVLVLTHQQERSQLEAIAINSIARSPVSSL